MKGYLSAEGVLGVVTNRTYWGWSFGHPPKSVSVDDARACELCLELDVDPRLDFGDVPQKLQKYHYWRCEEGADEIFYERIFVGGRKLRLYVSGLVEGKPIMRTNPDFLHFIRFRFNNLHSPGYHLTDIACAQLLRRGYSPLHCSAFAVDGKAVVVVAPPDTGKTLTTMMATADYGAAFLSEDLAITDGQRFYPCPWTSTFRYYDQFNPGRLSRMWMKFTKIFPPAELIPAIGNTKTIEQYMASEQIITGDLPVSHVIFLTRREGGVTELAPDEAKRLLFNLNRYEFNYIKNPLLVAYSYFHPSIELNALLAKEEAILGQLVEQSTCLSVATPDATQFAPLLFKALGA